MFRENYDIPVSTRVDQRTKDKLDELATRQEKKLAELLRDIILAALPLSQETIQLGELLPPEPAEEFRQAKAGFAHDVARAIEAVKK